MLSAEQEKEKDAKILTVAKEFLNNPTSMEKISEITGISSSSVQRYLNDERIKTLLSPKDFDMIQYLLKQNRLESQRKGGIISTKNNIPTRNEEGKFTGNISRR